MRDSFREIPLGPRLRRTHVEQKALLPAHHLVTHRVQFRRDPERQDGSAHGDDRGGAARRCAVPLDRREARSAEPAVVLSAHRRAAAHALGGASRGAQRHATYAHARSFAGELLHVLSSLERRSERWDTDPESARAALSAAISLLLRLLERDPDPAKSREHVLLSGAGRAPSARGSIRGRGRAVGRSGRAAHQRDPCVVRSGDARWSRSTRCMASCRRVHRTRPPSAHWWR
jgi:hypothetical protein